MNRTGVFILAVSWILGSLLWFFWIENTAVGFVWLCGGMIELIIAWIRYYKEKKRK